VAVRSWMTGSKPNASTTKESDQQGRGVTLLPSQVISIFASTADLGGKETSHETSELVARLQQIRWSPSKAQRLSATGKTILRSEACHIGAP
jgi:hypothetical protein